MQPLKPTHSEISSHQRQRSGFESRDLGVFGIHMTRRVKLT
ncbi:hypothetical protein PDIG_74930 [Penicillium digitatum PHI26]|uniref:Uncharacterized protein n=1 Tax=Penicillium digitatum (strain PHI26 / CECT 20796) TaxID=1170229 RepID=K9FDA3_PEND2|nr:hypothetical protein PDIG_74930 [Penicillium digitatum PHI26]